MHITIFQKIEIILKIIFITVKKALLAICSSIVYRNSWSVKDGDKIVHSWARDLLRVMRAKVDVFDPHSFEFSSKRPYIIMSNHLSHFDIPLIYAAFPGASVRMIAKKELFRIPIFGWAMKSGGFVTIDRKNKRQALKDLAVAKEKMLAGIRVWIAPEGTRSRTGELGLFKKGGFKIAIDTEAIIIPVTIIGSNKILPAKTLDFSLNENVKIYIGKEIDTKDYRSQDIKKLMTVVENAIFSGRNKT